MKITYDIGFLGPQTVDGTIEKVSESATGVSLVVQADGNTATIELTTQELHAINSAAVVK